MKATRKPIPFFKVTKLAVTLVTFYVMNVSPCFAQNKGIDSLYSVLKTEKEDTNKINTLTELAYQLGYADKFRASDSLAHLALDMAQKMNFKRGIASAYFDIGYNYCWQDNYVPAMEYQTKALTIFREIADKKGIGTVCGNIGLIYSSQSNYPEALKYMTLGLKADSDANNPEGMAGICINMGNVYQGEGNFADAIRSYMKALKFYGEKGNKLGMASAYGNMGNIFNDQGNFPEALKNYLLALAIDSTLGDKRGMGNAYGNMGNVYYHQHDYDNALKYHLLSLEMKKAVHNKKGIAHVYGNIGMIYEEKNNYDKALENYSLALAIYNEMNDKQGVATTYGNTAIVYDDEHNYSKALELQLKYLSMAREIGDMYLICSAYEGAASSLIALKKFARAKPYLDSALAISKRIGIKDVIRNTYGAFAELDSATGNYKAAFIDFKNFIVYRDSLNNEESTKKIVSSQMQYEFDKKEAEAKAEQDKKDVITKADERKQEIITGSVSVGLLLVLVFSGLLFSRFKITQKQKKIIEEQKALVEEKNKEVLDSITYAKRLQDAILPPISTITKYLPESFVLYKPKDIVAGDFYWIAPLSPEGGFSATTENPLLGGRGAIIAACDCTGHGVPGAMVSVVCSNALNRAVKEFKITEPGKILDKTRELVLETFEKSESQVNDGMDISLASLTPSEGGITIQWAGAYNPLWIVTAPINSPEGGIPATTENPPSEGREAVRLMEITPDKQPIGKTDNPKPFTTHTITLTPPSEGREAGTLYLFTDGYADQFGGQKGKKFKYKQLQEMLLAISHQPLAEQKQILEQTLEEWKGGLEQVDDILIIGIRV